MRWNKSFEGTLHIYDADLQKMAKMLGDVNIKECPYFDLSDKYGNSARYYRENQWIPCSERLPKEEKKTYWVCTDGGYQHECRWTNVNMIWTHLTTDWHWNILDIPQYSKVIAWMPLPEPARLEDFNEKSKN